LFALDLPDEEPADLLLRVLVRVRDDSVVAGSGEGHEREDPLVHRALHEAVASHASLRDDGRALGAHALEPQQPPAPRRRGDPVGYRAIGPKPAPRLAGGAGEPAFLAASLRGG